MRKRDLLLATVGLLVFWQLAAMLINKPVLPPPWEVLRAFLLALPQELGRHMLVSVVSAVSLDELTAWSDNKIPVVRIMPNTAIEFGESMTCIAGTSKKAESEIEELFNEIAGADKFLQFDKLEVDLGLINPELLEDQISENLYITINFSVLTGSRSFCR